ncbi:MAG TPA: signal peptidase I [Polyangiaceae bacterium]|jgi:signal peptidase I|nr:signal peptidase I [Polyangiaceae bacterium]
MRTWLKLVGWVGGILGAVVLILYVFVFDVWTVPSDDPMESASIEPTLSAGDVVLVSRHTSVTRGNLLRCPDPQAPGRFVIARAIAPSGEHIEISNEVVTIDGKRLPSPRACDVPVALIHDPQTDQDVNLRCSIEDYGERDFWALRADTPEPPSKALVEPGRWFLVSDDRHVHVDSRDFGQIDVSTCLHIVFRIEGKAGLGDEKKRLNVIW